MSIHTLHWTFEEIGKGKNKSLEVEFECHVSPGSPGSYWEPPDPAEVQFADVTIIELLSNEGRIELNTDLEHTLKDVAFMLAEHHLEQLEESLLEQIGDYEDASREDYYDRKRDELRGC